MEKLRERQREREGRGNKANGINKNKNKEKQRIANGCKRKDGLKAHTTLFPHGEQNS